MGHANYQSGNSHQGSEGFADYSDFQSANPFNKPTIPLQFSRKEEILIAQQTT
jgi:hypothetical protein